MTIQFSVKNILRFSGAVLLAIGLAGAAHGQDVDAGPQNPDPVPPPANALNQQQMSDLNNYWTVDRRASAIPMTAPIQDAALGLPGPKVTQSASDPNAKPTLVPGWNPNSGLAPPAPGTKIVLADEPGSSPDGVSLQVYGSPPANPLDFANYGKFQRWTLFGNYLSYPRSVLGKLFFTNGGSNFVCSATVVNRSTIITAGHCVGGGGAQNYYTNFQFCPSYYGAGGGSPHPSRGCWNWATAQHGSGWFTNGSIDRDFACIVLQNTGTVIAGKIGDTTGWGGMAYNRGADEQVLSTGYPAGSPFPGFHIITTMAAEWYTVNQFPGDTFLSKYIGNDMTGGSSGGGWLLDWEHSNARYPAPPADTTNITDPYQNGGGGPYVHGVNSHSRCLGSCGTPTAVSGTFFSEMGSPMFEMNTGDGNDVQSIYDICANHANNNP